MKVKIADLRKVTECILAHLESNGIDTIDITDDYYWHVPQDTIYNPYQEPKKFTMGQLSDDWSELQEIMKGKKKPIGYALVWLSAVLRRVGEKTIS